jgi:hypothetical protein
MYALSPLWRRLFWTEVVICVIAPLVWWFAPQSYLTGFLRVSPASPTHHYLLIQAGSVVIGAWGYLLGRVLLAGRVHAATFNRLVEAMCIGDIVLLAIMPMSYSLGPERALFVTQHALAAFWLLVRVVFLTRVGWKSERELNA